MKVYGEGVHRELGSEFRVLRFGDLRFAVMTTKIEMKCYKKMKELCVGETLMFFYAFFISQGR